MSQIEAAKPAIDLTRHAWKRELGDLTLYGTWLYNEAQEDTEPCLVIIPTYRTVGFKPCCIALSSAFQYNDPRYLAQAAAVFAENLGFDTLTSAHRLANLIYDHLGDLVTMPNDPSTAIVVGEATINLGDGTRRTAEVLDYEQDR